MAGVKVSRQSSPGLYRWQALRDEVLSTAQISSRTGEIVFPEDVAARERWKQKLQQEKSVRAAVLPNLPPDREEVVSLDARAAVASEPAEAATTVEEPAAQSLNLKGPFRCEDCGMETMD